MAGSFSDYMEKEILDHLLKSGAWTQVTPLYLALGDTGADDTGLTNEFTVANNYARKAISSAHFGTSAASRSIANDAVITFNTASGAWGTPTNWGIFDASTAGNMIAWGTIVGAGAIGDTDTPSYAIGEIEIAMNAHVSNVGWSDAISHAILDHVFFGSEHTPATNLYVGFGTTPLADGDAISGEATGGGYAREICNGWDAATGTAPALADNTSGIAYTVSGDWTASLDVIFVADHETNTANANVLFFGTINSMSPVNGDVVEINAGTLDITLV